MHTDRRVSRRASGLRASVAAVLALAALVVASMPVAAFQVVSDTGQRGSYQFLETRSSPRVRCGYGSFVSNRAYLKWMRVKPPAVYAPDTDSGRIDSMQVGWRVLIQRYNLSTSTWRTVAQSTVQKARAYENAAASLPAIRVYHTASSVSASYRALVVINWYRANGTLAGQVKLAPDWTEMKQGTQIFPTGNPDCTGAIQRF